MNPICNTQFYIYYNPIPFAKIMRQKGTKTPPLPCSVALRGISVFITIGN